MYKEVGGGGAVKAFRICDFGERAVLASSDDIEDNIGYLILITFYIVFSS
jgi:hypothetical protein